MSLYVGNISSRIHFHELEHVFQKFGKSRLDKKDGYAFIIYENPRDAEKALESLKGKTILGEQLSIWWSKKQPVKKLNGSAFPKKLGNRGFSGESTRIRARHSPHHDTNAKNLRVNERYNADIAERRELWQDDKGDGFEAGKGREDNNHYSNEPLLGQGNDAETDPLVNDRWGEPFSEASSDHPLVEDALVLDRYDPLSVNDDGDNRRNKRHQNEKPDGSHTGISSSKQDPDHRSRQGHLQKKPERCYICGHLGHLQRQCPLPMKHKFKGFFLRNTAGNNLNRIKRDRASESSRQAMRSETKTSKWRDHSRKYSHGENNIDAEERTDSILKKRKRSRHQSIDRKELTSKEKKSNKRKRHRSISSSHESQEKDKSRSSSIHCEIKKKSKYSPLSTFSNSHSSRVSSLLARSKSHSSSKDPKPSSTSDKSPNSKSHSKSPVPESKSRSCSLQRSLSVSLTPHAYPTLSIAQTNHNDQSPQERSPPMRSSQHPVSHAKKQELSDVKKIVMDEKPLNILGNGLRLQVRAENDLRVRILQDSEENSDDNVNDSGNISCFNNLEQPDNPTIVIEKDSNMVEVNVTDEDDLKIDDKINCYVVKHARTSTETATQLGEPSSIFQEETVDGYTLDKSSKKHFLEISVEQIKSLLEHPGEDHTGDAKSVTSLETYLGASRIWPLDIVYYRRLKKGAITTENYSRRVAQNSAFNIVDKYVRSSSGWWESGRNFSCNRVCLAI